VPQKLEAKYRECQRRALARDPTKAAFLSARIEYDTQGAATNVAHMPQFGNFDSAEVDCLDRAVTSVSAGKASGATRRVLWMDLRLGDPPRPIGVPDYVLTRLHVRYSPDVVAEDLVFRVAGGIAGGREWRSSDGELSRAATSSGGGNAFQARYAIRHEWTGPIECEAPVRGIWGPNPAGRNDPVLTARDSDLVVRGAKLSDFVAQAVPELNVAGPEPKAAPPASPARSGPADTTGETLQATPPPGSGGCRSCAIGRPKQSPSVLWGLLPMSLVLRRVRKARQNEQGPAA
jgi:hypothetical protein